MLRAVNFVINTKQQALKLNPKKNGDVFTLEGISDSNYADDKEDRTSVYGYVIYFCGCPIAWKSKAGKSAVLSSTEAEYFAISEAAKEVLFVRQVLESVGVQIEYPIKIRVDNVGAMFLCNNFSTGQRTKHIDICAHFVRGYIEEEILKVVFVGTEDNDADIFTKNVVQELYEKHSKKFMEEAPK